MNWKDLEDRLIDAIQQCCQTDEDKKRALNYFKNCMINDLIEEALEE